MRHQGSLRHSSTTSSSGHTIACRGPRIVVDGAVTAAIVSAGWEGDARADTVGAVAAAEDV